MTRPRMKWRNPSVASEVNFLSFPNRGIQTSFYAPIQAVTLFCIKRIWEIDRVIISWASAKSDDFFLDFKKECRLMNKKNGKTGYRMSCSIVGFKNRFFH